MFHVRYHGWPYWWITYSLRQIKNLCLLQLLWLPAVRSSQGRGGNARLSWTSSYGGRSWSSSCSSLHEMAQHRNQNHIPKTVTPQRSSARVTHIKRLRIHQQTQQRKPKHQPVTSSDAMVLVSLKKNHSHSMQHSYSHIMAHISIETMGDLLTLLSSRCNQHRIWAYVSIYVHGSSARHKVGGKYNCTSLDLQYVRATWLPAPPMSNKET
jgi:hypothetical protein